MFSAEQQTYIPKFFQSVKFCYVYKHIYLFSTKQWFDYYMIVMYKTTPSILPVMMVRMMKNYNVYIVSTGTITNWTGELDPCHPLSVCIAVCKAAWEG